MDDPATARRDLCLDAVGDLLDTGGLPRAERERAVGRLVALALSARDDEVQESALHALCVAADHHQLSYAVIAPLAGRGDGEGDNFSPVLLPYVLAALSATYDRRALPLVQRYLRHPHPGVRAEAAEALRELRLGTARP
ncbi:hypothetical protein WQ59_15330 [Streptomyces sp. KE1]|nr:hypothetical protein WQ59_15330 [Streptomyces sp. KE1]